MSKPKIVKIAVAALIAFASVTVTTNAAESSSPTEPAAAALIGVRVEHDGLSESAAAAIVDLAIAAEQRLSPRYGSAPSPAEAGRRILVVHVSPGPFSGDYLVRVEAHLDGVLIGDVGPEPCLSCSVVQIVDGIEAAAAELVSQFPVPVRELEPALAQQTDEPTPSDEPAQQGVALGRMTSTGIGVTVVGVAGVGAGIALIAVHERAEPNQGQPLLRVVDYRPAGIALAVVGGAALIAGVTLIVLGARERHEQRTALVPAFGPEYAGGVLVGRF